jgi:nitroreductase
MPKVNSRTADHPIEPIFLERWSPRAFTGEPIPDETLKTLFEAARWAPSSYNSQPWRFLYAKRDTPHWKTFLGLLGEGNQAWAKNAAVLMILVSKKTMMVPGKDVPIESYSHSLDAGAGWAYLALQAAKLGWDAHGMVGFDQSRSATELKIPADHRVEMAIAIGKRGDKSILPEALAAREAPNGRNSQAQFTFEGEFRA